MRATSYDGCHNSLQYFLMSFEMCVEARRPALILSSVLYVQLA